MDPNIPGWALALGVMLVVAASITLYLLLRAVDQPEEEIAEPAASSAIQSPVRVLEPDELAWALEPPAPGAFPLLPDRSGKFRRLRLLYGGWSRAGILRARWRRGRGKAFRVTPENIRWRHPQDGML